MADDDGLRKTILIAASMQAAAALVAADKFGNTNAPGYPADAVAALAKQLMDQMMAQAERHR
jgi:hypothetical protein